MKRFTQKNPAIDSCGGIFCYWYIYFDSYIPKFEGSFMGYPLFYALISAIYGLVSALSFASHSTSVGA